MTHYISAHPIGSFSNPQLRVSAPGSFSSPRSMRAAQKIWEGNQGLIEKTAEASSPRASSQRASPNFFGSLTDFSQIISSSSDTGTRSLNTSPLRRGASSREGSPRSLGGSPIFKISPRDSVRISAARGDMHAEFTLGCAYALGKDVAQSYEQAITCWEKAGELGHPEAQFYLAIAYADGKIVARSYPKAIYWFKKCAAQGRIEAWFNLGLAYANGYGVEQSFEQARYWFQKVADAGDYSQAQEMLDDLDALLSSETGTT